MRFLLKFCWAFLVITVCLSPLAHGDNPARIPTSRTVLGYGVLTAGSYPTEIDLSAFAPAGDAREPSQQLEGTLRIIGSVESSVVARDGRFISPEQTKAARTFPSDFSYDFVQKGNVLLPVRRGYIVTSHLHWDLVLEPGRVWDEPGDHGYSRAGLPFALIQKHMNCTHYGVMTFLFKSDGAVSHAAVQISSETCRYFKVDMWGLLNAKYMPHAVPEKADVVASYQRSRAHRLPERPISRLARDYPGIKLSALAMGKRKTRTLYGLVVDGVNYVSPCPTRYGNYPYCDVLPFPSYSLAKSVEAALALMAVEQDDSDVLESAVGDYVPSDLCDDWAWDDATFGDLLSMATGHYDSKIYMADEDSPKVGRFFSATTKRQKTRFSCNAYPRRSKPGTAWVYHTSDTFLLGVVLTQYLRNSTGNGQADVFRDVVVNDIYKPLGLSATALTTRRTADQAGQPFFGYGLQFHRGDVAKLALFIGKKHGRIGGSRVLDADMLNAAMQRAGGHHDYQTGLPTIRYQFGFWARNIAPVVGCKKPVWVPFMSGFGGLSVVLYPNDTVYYSVLDDGSTAAFDWSVTAQTVETFGNLCR